MTNMQQVNKRPGV